MLAPTQIETRQEYGTAFGWRLFIYLFMPPLIILFLAMPFLLWKEGQHIGQAVGVGVVAVGMALSFLYGLAETIKARHIITADTLIYRGVLRRKKILLANLRGYRIDQQYTRFYSTNPADPEIRIGYTSEKYTAMQQWFADRYPNLDELEQEQATISLLADNRLGSTPEEREKHLVKARRTAKWLNSAGGIVAAWLLLQPQPYHWAIAAGLIVPVAAMAAVWFHPGVLRLDERKNSAYPSLVTAILMPSLLLLLRGLLDFEILDYGNLWLPAMVISVLLALAMLAGSRQFLLQQDSRLSLVLAALAYAVLYGYAATVIYNCAYDEGRATEYTVQVLTKHKSSSKTTTYYLKVCPWGPRATADDVTVSREYYQQAKTGDKIHIYQMPGKLHVPWFTVAE